MSGKFQPPDTNFAAGILFATTHWSSVLAAGHPEAPEARAALERLCRTYWFPIYAFIRRHGHNLADAQDLTQEFFLQLLKRGDLASADPKRGRFRWFLLTAVKHFLANEWRKVQTQKRGGGQTFVPFDGASAEQRYQLEDVRELPPDRLYERSWALTMLYHARDQLRAEYGFNGKADKFELLEQFLPGEESEATYAEAGRRLGLTESAVKSEVFRLKRRYRNLLRQAVAQTVAQSEDVDDEIRYLAALLAG